MKNFTLYIFSIILFSCSPNNTAEEIIENAVNKIETAQVKNSSFDYGNAKSGVYTNNYFDFEIKFDTSWHVQSQAQLNGLVKRGQKMLENNELLNKAIEASKVNTAYLFAMFKYEVGAAVQSNPSLMVVAENTKSLPGIKKGKDYLFHAKNSLSQTQLNYTFDPISETKKLGSFEFDILTAKLDVMTKKIVQEYITTVTDGFALSFILSYTSDQEKEELYKVIEGMKAIN